MIPGPKSIQSFSVFAVTLILILRTVTDPAQLVSPEQPLQVAVPVSLSDDAGRQIRSVDDHVPTLPCPADRVVS